MIVSATGYVYEVGSNINEQMDVAAGGIFVCGLALGLIGVVVMFFGSKWIEVLMPPGNTSTLTTSFYFKTEYSSCYWNGCHYHWYSFVHFGT